MTNPGSVYRKLTAAEEAVAVSLLAELGHEPDLDKAVGRSWCRAKCVIVLAPGERPLLVWFTRYPDEILVDLGHSTMQRFGYGEMSYGIAIAGVGWVAGRVAKEAPRPP